MKGILATLRRFMFVLPTRRIKRILPQGLFGRTLLIIVVPTLLTLALATFIFFDRHWYTITHRLTHAVAGDVAVFTTLLESTKSAEEQYLIKDLAFIKLDITVAFKEEGTLPKPPRHFVTPLEEMLRNALRERVSFPFLVDMRSRRGAFTIYVKTPAGLYTLTIPERRIYTPTTEVFIGWMLGSSVLLSAVALLFMRNQVRPVRRLAAAAESIGKGQDAPWFKPEGAKEVRQASAALMQMRDRLRRAMNQRTAMLAGVSHDLRTPITRMKLQLAMMPESAQTRGFHDDIKEMENMLEAYLSFARGEEAETAAATDLGKLTEDVVRITKTHNSNISVKATTSLIATIRPNAFKRCLDNLIVNALRYGKNAVVTVSRDAGTANIFIDDDGPGIPVERREDVFKPFLRLDESRNMDTGGVGLGLSIARDIARAHGGDITLGESPSGGLRAHLWIPV